MGNDGIPPPLGLEPVVGLPQPKPLIWGALNRSRFTPANWVDSCKLHNQNALSIVKIDTITESVA